MAVDVVMNGIFTLWTARRGMNDLELHLINDFIAAIFLIDFDSCWHSGMTSALFTDSFIPSYSLHLIMVGFYLFSFNLFLCGDRS
jgi:hypothetical protein